MAGTTDVIDLLALLGAFGAPIHIAVAPITRNNGAETTAGDFLPCAAIQTEHGVNASISFPTVFPIVSDSHRQS